MTRDDSPAGGRGDVVPSRRPPARCRIRKGRKVGFSRPGMMKPGVPFVVVLQSEPVRHLWTLLVLVAALINLAPILGAVAPERMAAFYGVALEDPNLQILMRHRAVLFGLVGGLLLAATLHRPLRLIAYALGFSSMLTFLFIAWLVGGYGPEIERVIRVDMAGIAALTGASLVDVIWLRASDT